MIRFKDVTFSYNKRAYTVEGLTTHIPQGQALALLGHNGAGKTTTLRLMLGILRPQSGDISVGGFVPGSSRAPRGMVAYMPEVNGIYEKLTGFQNLEFRARAAWIQPECIRRMSEKWLERLGLLERGDEKAGFWSKGMRQRLSLACALICQPRILLLDEPTNGLDPESLSIVVRLLQEVHDEGMTVVVSSHDLHSVHQICEQVVILQKGRCVYAGSLEGSAESLQELYLKATTREHDAGVSQ